MKNRISTISTVPVSFETAANSEPGTMFLTEEKEYLMRACHFDGHKTHDSIFINLKNGCLCPGGKEYKYIPLSQITIDSND